MKKFIIASVLYSFCAMAQAKTQIEFILNHKKIIQTKDIIASKPIETNSNSWGLLITLTDDANKNLTTVTKTNIGKKMDLVLNGKTVSSPVIQSEISGPISLAANLSEKEAKEISSEINGKN